MNQDKTDDMQEGILIVDDDPGHLSMLRATLEGAGYEIYAAPDGDVAAKVALRRSPDLILLDISLGTDEMAGFEVCRKLKADPATESIPVVFVTGRGEVENVIEGLRVGGIDYIVKPFAGEEVLARVQNHLKTQRLTRELKRKNLELEDEIRKREEADQARKIAEDARRKADRQLSMASEQEAKRWGIDGLIGKSPTFIKILQDIDRLREIRTVSILITGENGTGKGMVARAIHRGIHRDGSGAIGPFIPVICPTIPNELAESVLFGHVRGAFTGAHRRQEGAFEQADGGTIFLDEIGVMPQEIQAKLLGVLETRCITPIGGVERKVDVRVLAATNVDLTEMIRQGRFRRDLYFRLREYEVVVPPLRERKEDIKLLASHFLKMSAAMEIGKAEVSLSPEALEVLESYSFPGNVRELRNVMMRAFIDCDGPEILPEHLHFTQFDEAIDSEDEDQKVKTLAEKVISETTGYRKATKQFQRRLIEQILKETDWNRHEAARRLDMDRSNLLKLIKSLEIKEPVGDT